MAKHSIQITDSKLYESIVEYCKENGLKVSFLCTDMLRKQFLIEKFGDIPFGNFQDSSLSYDNKSVTSSVIGPLNTNGDAIVIIETIDKNSGETTIKKINMHKDPPVDTQTVTAPWVPVDCSLTVEEIQKLSAEEIQKLSLEGENNNVIITSPLTKEIDGRYTQKEVPDKFYSEIKVEDVNKEAEETQKHTEKPKKRRL